MKNVEPAIYEKLKGLAGGRVYAMRAPQNSVTPFIVFQRIDSSRWRHINGPDGFNQASIQVDCYASGYYAAKDLGASVETLLDGFRGLVYYGTTSPPSHVRIAGISLQQDMDILDETAAPVLYRNSATFLVTYSQED